MNYYGLTEPSKIEDKNILNDVKKEYKILYDTFIDPQVRPQLKGINIFIENKKILGMEERYLHAISLEEKESYRKYPPCTNDITNAMCLSKCDLKKAANFMYTLERVECQFRLARIHWIPEVIKYANDENESTKVWQKSTKGKNGKFYETWYVRYENLIVDFLIVFHEMRDPEDKSKIKYLNFRTAYPVFFPGDKKTLDDSYKQYLKENK